MHLPQDLQLMIERQQSIEDMINSKEKEIEARSINVSSFEQNKDIARAIKMEIDMIYAQ